MEYTFRSIKSLYQQTFDYFPAVHFTCTNQTEFKMYFGPIFVEAVFTTILCDLQSFAFYALLLVMLLSGTQFLFLRKYSSSRKLIYWAL